MGVTHDLFHPRVYVANTVSNDVSVIDRRTNTVVTSIPVGTEPDGVAVGNDPLHPRVCITLPFSDAVAVVDADTNKVIATVSLLAGSLPIGVAATK